MTARPNLTVAASALACLIAVASCYSADATQPNQVTIVGPVKRAAATAVEAATVLAADKVLYRIVKDAKGAIVARDAANKKAEIRGTLSERDGQKWITVSWCALVE